MPSQPALDLIDLCLKATEAYQRPDLTARLRETRARVADPELKVLVVGEFKQGKSALVNALVSAQVCPVDDDIATSVTTAVKYTSGQPSVTVVRQETGGDGEVRQARTDVAVNDLSRYVSEAGNPGNRENVAHVEVTVPSKVLSTGLVVVDTPGVGGLGSAHGAMTMAALPTADAVLMVSDASAEYTAPEIAFLQQAASLCRNVACVLTKTDMYPEWKRIADLDRGHLTTRGLPADLLPVSSNLRRKASASKDAALNEESGFKDLVVFLRDRVIGQAEKLDRRIAAQDVLSAVEQMSQKMRVEIAAQSRPQDAAALIADLTLAKQRAEDLKKRSARWQQTLNDGFGDLQSDIDHDLRDRMRGLQKQAEDVLDAEDPGEIYDQFAAWLYAQVSRAASTNFVWATQRAQHLAGQVADHFVAGGEMVLPDVERRSGRFGGHINPMVQPDMAKFRFGSQLLTGLKGGQQGMMMFGMVSSLALGAMLNPISGAAAVLFAAKGVKDEKKRLVEKRRAEVKQAMRKHVEDVTFQVGKDSRDMLRGVQRTLRDHFTDVAQEMATSMTESVQSAQEAVQSAQGGGGDRRVKDLETELERLATVETRAKALVADD